MLKSIVNDPMEKKQEGTLYQNALEIITEYLLDHGEAELKIWIHSKSNANDTILIVQKDEEEERFGLRKTGMTMDYFKVSKQTLEELLSHETIDEFSPHLMIYNNFLKDIQTPEHKSFIQIVLIVVSSISILIKGFHGVGSLLSFSIPLFAFLLFITQTSRQNHFSNIQEIAANLQKIKMNSRFHFGAAKLFAAAGMTLAAFLEFGFFSQSPVISSILSVIFYFCILKILWEVIMVSRRNQNITEKLLIEDNNRWIKIGRIPQILTEESAEKSSEIIFFSPEIQRMEGELEDILRLTAKYLTASTITDQSLHRLKNIPQELHNARELCSRFPENLQTEKYTELLGIILENARSYAQEYQQKEVKELQQEFDSQKYYLKDLNKHNQKV